MPVYQDYIPHPIHSSLSHPIQVQVIRAAAIQAVAAVTAVVVVQAAVRAAAVQVAMEAEAPVVAVLRPDGE